MSLESYINKYATKGQYPVRFKLNKDGKFVFVAKGSAIKRPEKSIKDSPSYQRDERLAAWLKNRDKQS